MSYLVGRKPIWCPGCPLHWGLYTLAEVFGRLGLKKENLWVISGIGCTGRMANYFACNTLHTTHGRAIPVAEGVKIAQPEAKVVVISGDGDLLSIGLGHLLHAARRNSPLTVICFNNQVYAMTGGQTSPTTPKGRKTKTEPLGVRFPPLKPKKLLEGFRDILFAQTLVFQTQHFVTQVQKALTFPGFSFVEVISFCRVNNLDFRKAKDPNLAIAHFLKEQKVKLKIS